MGRQDSKGATPAPASPPAPPLSNAVDAEWLVGLRKSAGGYVVVVHLPRTGVTQVVSNAPGRLEHASVELRRTLARLVGGT